MAGGPGGTEVGRVSVKVVPDTSKFAAELKTKLAALDDEFQVAIDLNTKKALANYQALKRKIERDEINATIDYRSKGLGRAGRGGSSMLQRLSGMLAMPIKAFGDFFSTVGSGLSNLAKQTTGFVSTFTSGMGRFSSSLGKGIKGIAGMAATLLSLVLVGSLLAGVFAAISGAVMLLVGALTAVLTTIPLLIAGLAAPIAAIALGFDGIKEAAKTLTPQIESLKSVLSEKFQDGFTPIFEKLKGLFPSLETGLSMVADRVIDLADRLTELVSTEEGIRKIEAAFRGIDSFLALVNPGVVRLTGSFLDIVATEPLFTTLGRTLGGVLTQLADFFDRIREGGTLAEGLLSLESVLKSVTGLFTTLMESALEFFNGAAPGISDFFEGLDSFFSKMNWEALGESFGRIFSAIGDFFANIDQGAIDQFVYSFIIMGETVKGFIESGGLSVLSGLLMGLNYAFSFVMLGMTMFINALKGVGIAVDLVSTGIGLAWDWIVLKTQELKNRVSNAQRAIRDVISRVYNRVVDIVRNAWQTVSSWTRDKWNEITSTIGRKVNEAVQFVRQLPSKAVQALSNAGSALVASGRALIEGFIRGIKSKISAAVNTVKSAVSRVRNFFPFSPAKVGPFAGRGYTTFSGRALVEDWAKGIQQASPEALRSVQSLMDSANNAASADWNAHVSSDGFGGVRNAVFDGVMDAFNGSRLQVDGNGMAKVVNNVNARNARR